MLNEFSPLRLAEAEDTCQFREPRNKGVETKNHVPILDRNGGNAPKTWGAM